MKKKYIWLIIIPLLVLVGRIGDMTNDDNKANISSIAEYELHKEDDKYVWLRNVPKYSGEAYAIVNDNKPFFKKEDYTTKTFESYAKLDNLGRCGVAFALIGQETMPISKREDIGDIRPSGWHTVRYDDIIKDKYLYNRCHLIAFELSGENANPNNLITGTRYMNVEGMLPFENKVANYVKFTKNHVLYRVTPVFEGKNLVASGVLIEAYSIEDSGKGIMFNVYCYNVQPGINIDYTTGTSFRIEKTELPTQTTKPQKDKIIYILNTHTLKFHFPSCASVREMSEKNKLEFKGTREEVIYKGYFPCKKCNP